MCSPSAAEEDFGAHRGNPEGFPRVPLSQPQYNGLMDEADPTQAAGWLQQAAAGDAESWSRLLALYHDRLRRMVTVRLDPRVRPRVDPSDVLQEAYLEGLAKLKDYVEKPTVPVFLWLRGLACNRLQKAHRRHLIADCRAAGREVALDRLGPPASSVMLAEQIVGKENRPSEAARRDELCRRVRELLDSMDPIDREVLSLRHFEQLSTPEVAEVLGIQPKAAAKRYVRALARLRDLLQGMPGAEDLRP
jgi:RNA polymerase sigma-70 factor (ECF subfamily)